MSPYNQYVYYILYDFKIALLPEMKVSGFAAFLQYVYVIYFHASNFSDALQLLCGSRAAARAALRGALNKYNCNIL